LSLGRSRALPSEQQSLLTRVHEIVGMRGGCFDAFTWKADSIVFAESKWWGHDRIRKSQLRWLSAALEFGLPPESFLVVEWSVEV
jgi:hypothetical protein